jgi:large subunit ribosomal protein L9
MKVLLIKDVKSLGKTGEIKEVKDGYGKNFLIGKGFAKHATDAVIAEWKEQNRLAAEAEAQEIADLTLLKEKLENLDVKISKKLGDTGHLFGAVTKDDIAKTLESDHNIVIDKKHIETKKAIKMTGKHEVDLKLGHGIHALLHIDVVGE